MFGCHDACPPAVLPSGSAWTCVWLPRATLTPLLASSSSTAISAFLKGVLVCLILCVVSSASVGGPL